MPKTHPDAEATYRVIAFDNGKTQALYATVRRVAWRL
jgi:hypothetical protein